MRRTLAIAVAGVMLMAFGSASAAQITPTKLIGGPTNQIMPTINATYIAWTENSTAHPKRYDDYYQPLPVGSGSPVRMNAGSTDGYHPSFDGDGNTAVMQVAAGSDSNVVLYDLTNHTTSSPPNGVDTSNWEWWPTVSQGFIEFGRNKFNTARSPWSVMLYNPNTTNTRVLASEPNKCQCIYPGQVSTDYATWTDCPKNCNVYFYTVADSSTHRIPNPRGLVQYMPSVDAATNTFYYARGGAHCGQNIKIMRWTIGDANPTVIASLPNGYDVDWRTFDYIDGSTNDNIVFDQFRCAGSYYSDIYEVANANTASPTVLRVGSAPTSAQGRFSGASVAGSRPSVGGGAGPR